MIKYDKYLKLYNSENEQIKGYEYKKDLFPE